MNACAPRRRGSCRVESLGRLTYCLPMSITLELPEIVKQQIGETPEAVTRALLETAALEGYRTGRLSRWEVRDTLALNWPETEEFLARHGCVRTYLEEDLAQEQESISHFLKRG